MNRRSFLQGATALFASLLAGPEQIEGPVVRLWRRGGSLLGKTIHSPPYTPYKPFPPWPEALEWAFYYIDTEAHDRTFPGAWSHRSRNTWIPNPIFRRETNAHARRLRERISPAAAADRKAKDAADRWVEDNFDPHAPLGPLYALVTQWSGCSVTMEPIQIEEVT